METSFAGKANISWHSLMTNHDISEFTAILIKHKNKEKSKENLHTFYALS